MNKVCPKSGPDCEIAWGTGVASTLLADFQQQGRSCWEMSFSLTLFRSINKIQSLPGTHHDVILQPNRKWSVVVETRWGRVLGRRAAAEFGKPTSRRMGSPSESNPHCGWGGEVCGRLFTRSSAQNAFWEWLRAGPYLDPSLYTTAAPKPGVWSLWLPMWNYLLCQITSQLGGMTGGGRLQGQ